MSSLDKSPRSELETRKQRKKKKKELRKSKVNADIRSIVEQVAAKQDESSGLSDFDLCPTPIKKRKLSDQGEESGALTSAESTAQSPGSMLHSPPTPTRVTPARNKTSKSARRAPRLRFKHSSSYRRTYLDNASFTNQEVWLLQVPPTFDVSRLDGVQGVTDGSVSIANQGVDDMYDWELNIKPLPKPEDCDTTVLLPSDDHSLTPVGPVQGIVSVRKSLTVVPHSLPPRTSHKVEVPSNLKIRYVPFGSDTPSLTFSYKDLKRTKKKKKQREKEEEEEDEMDLALPRITSLTKKRKKHNKSEES